MNVMTVLRVTQKSPVECGKYEESLAISHIDSKF